MMMWMVMNLFWLIPMVLLVVERRELMHLCMIPKIQTVILKTYLLRLEHNNTWGLVPLERDTQALETT